MASAAPVAPAAAAPAAPAAPAPPAINLDTPARWVMATVTKDAKNARRGEGAKTNFRNELTEYDEYLDRKCVRWTGPKKTNPSYSKPELGDNFLWVTDYDAPDGVYVGQIVGNAEPRHLWGTKFKGGAEPEEDDEAPADPKYDTFEIRVWGKMKWEAFRVVMGYKKAIAADPANGIPKQKAYKLRGTIRTGKDKPKIALRALQEEVTQV